MLQSSNDAAVALAIAVSGSQERFVAAMNRRAEQLGMRATEFFSPNGLDDRGRSSARDLAIVVRAAYATPGFAPIVATKFKTIPAPKGTKPRHIQNRNALLWLYPGAIGVEDGVHGRRRLLPHRCRGARRPPAPRDRAGFERRTVLRGGHACWTTASKRSPNRPSSRTDRVSAPSRSKGGAVLALADGSLTALVPTAQADRAAAAHRDGAGRDLPPGAGAADRHPEGHAPGDQPGVGPGGRAAGSAAAAGG